MTFWKEEQNEQSIDIANDVVDLSFRIQCKTLPVDHGWALSRAILHYLPWLSDEPNGALHQILVAESGNGWLSPDDGNEILYPSRRTRLTIRLPQQRVDETISTLNGVTLDVDGHTMKLDRPESRLLSKITTIYTRFAILHDSETEDDFLRRISQELAERQIYPKKMVCGRTNLLKTEQGTIQTNSLMLADLTPQEAITLQQRGLSEGKDFGCGLFLPHKTVENRLQEQE